MAAFNQPAAGDDIVHTDVTQFAKAWDGEAAGGSHPMQLTQVNDATHYAADVKQNNAGGLVGRFLNHLGQNVLTMIHNTLTIGQNVVVAAGKLIDGVDISAHTHTGAAGHGPQIPTAALVDGFLSADAAGRLKTEDGYTTAAKLATDAVETAKIKDLNVTAGKLAVDSVETAKIKDLNVTEAKLAAAVSAQLVTGGDTHDHDGGDGAQIPVAGLAFDPATQMELNAHEALEAAGTHGSTVAATADKLVHRDAAGRAKVVAPALATDIALKSTVTADIGTHQALTSPHSATANPTASRLIVRDASGRAAVAAPAAADDIARKDTVDTHAAVAWAHSSVSGAVPSRIIIRDAAGRAKVVAPAVAADIALKSTVTADIGTHSAGGDHDGRYFTEAEQDARFAPIAKGVTNGDAHDHDGGDGAPIPTAAIANDAIDDSKVGNRVAQFHRRQGGSATDWSQAGGTNRTPYAVRMQAGSCGSLNIVAGATNSRTITFPTAFDEAPIVWVSLGFWSLVMEIDLISVAVFSTTKTQVVVKVKNGDVLDRIVNIHWLAIGPE